MATASSQSYYNEVQSIFIELFDRPAGTAGYNYFGSELATGANPVTVFGQIAGSSEVSSSLTVNTLFENLLGRAPAAAGLAFFNGELAAGMTIAQVASQIYFDVLNEPTNSQDYMVMTDKIAYANSYTGYLAGNPSFTYSTQNAKAYITQVTPAGVMAGTVTATTMPPVNSFVAGTTVPLLSSSTSYIEPSNLGIVNFVDNLAATGTPKPAGQSIGNYILQAGAGDATLTVTSSGTGYSSFTIPTNMSGVSNIVMSGLATAPTVDFSGATGVTNITVSPLLTSTPPLNFTGTAEFTISDTQTLTIKNDDQSSSNVVKVVSTGTSVAIDLNNVGAYVSSTSTVYPAAITVTGTSSSSKTTSVTLSSLANSTNYVSISDGTHSAVSSITVKDAAATASTTLSSTSTDTHLATLTADNTGALTFNIANSDFASAFTFDGTAGSGQQTIGLGAAPTTGNTYTFDGGTNANNTVDVNYGAATSALYAYLGSAVNFQTLDFTSADTTSAASIILGSHGISTSFDNFILGNAPTGIYAFSGVTNSDHFAVTASATGTLAISDGTGYNTANVAFASSLATSVKSGTSLTTLSVTLGTLDTNAATGAGNSNPSIVNITSNDGAANGANGTSAGTSNEVTNTITTLTVGDGATVNLSGTDTYNTFNATIDNGTSSPTQGVTFNASGFAGTLGATAGTSGIGYTFTLGSGADTITTNTGANDTITVGTASTASDTINANAVAFSGTTTILSASSSYAATNYDAITNGSALNVNDSLVFATTATNTPTTPLINENSNVKALATLGDALSTVIHNLQVTDEGLYTTTNTVNNNEAWFNYGGNTYVVSDTTTTTAINTPSALHDVVVTITGTVDLSNATVALNTTTHLATVSNL